MKNSSLRIYEQLKEKLPDWKNKEDPIPTESELSRQLEVDRFAIRRALQRLVGEGRLQYIRHHGYRFPKEQLEVRLDSQTSYTAFCRQAHVPPRAEILAVSHEYPTPVVAEALECTIDDLVWHIWFRRYSNDIPHCLTHSYLPYDRTHGLLGHLRKEPSLYRTLSTHYGIQPRRVSSRIRALTAGNDEAKLLDIALAAALLEVCSWVHDQDGKPIEYCETHYRADSILLTIDISQAENLGFQSQGEGGDNDPKATH